MASLIKGIKEQASRATRLGGAQAVRQVMTRFVTALRQRHPQLSLLSELEAPELETPLPPDVTRQVEEILERLSREDDP